MIVTRSNDGSGPPSAAQVIEFFVSMYSMNGAAAIHLMRGEAMHARSRHMKSDEHDKRPNLYGPTIGCLGKYLPTIQLDGGCTDDGIDECLDFLDASGACSELRLAHDEGDVQAGTVFWKGSMIGLKKGAVRTTEEVDEAMAGTDPRKALISKILIILVSDFSSRVSYPLTFYGTTGISSDELRRICDDIKARIEARSAARLAAHTPGSTAPPKVYVVKGASGDGLGANVKFTREWNLLGLWSFVDYPHVDKNIRNNVQKKGFHLVSMRGSAIISFEWNALWNLMIYGNFVGESGTKNQPLVALLENEQLLTPGHLQLQDIMNVRVAKAVSTQELEDALRAHLPASPERDALCQWMKHKRGLYNLFHRNEFEGKDSYIRSGEISGELAKKYVAWLKQKLVDCEELTSYYSRWFSALRATNKSCISAETSEAIEINLEQYKLMVTAILTEAEGLISGDASLTEASKVTWIFDGKSTSTNPVECYISLLRRTTNRGGAVSKSYLSLAMNFKKVRHELLKKLVSGVTVHVQKTESDRNTHYPQRSMVPANVARVRSRIILPRRNHRVATQTLLRRNPEEIEAERKRKSALALGAAKHGITLAQASSGIMNRQRAKGLINGRDVLKLANRVIAIVDTKTDKYNPVVKGYAWVVANHPYDQVRVVRLYIGGGGGEIATSPPSLTTPPPPLGVRSRGLQPLDVIDLPPVDDHKDGKILRRPAMRYLDGDEELVTDARVPLPGSGFDSERKTTYVGTKRRITYVGVYNVHKTISKDHYVADGCCEAWLATRIIRLRCLKLGKNTKTGANKRRRGTGGAKRNNDGDASDASDDSDDSNDSDASEEEEEEEEEDDVDDADDDAHDDDANDDGPDEDLDEDADGAGDDDDEDDAPLCVICGDHAVRAIGTQCVACSVALAAKSSSNGKAYVMQKGKKVILYEVSEIVQPEVGEVTCSCCNNTGADWKPMHGRFRQLSPTKTDDTGEHWAYTPRGLDVFWRLDDDRDPISLLEGTASEGGGVFFRTRDCKWRSWRQRRNA